MQHQERNGTAHDRIGRGTAEAIRKVYPPDASCDARLDSLIEQLDQLPMRKGAGNGGERAQ